jgi:hypothetical protein
MYLRSWNSKCDEKKEDKENVYGDTIVNPNLIKYNEFNESIDINEDDDGPIWF